MPIAILAIHNSSLSTNRYRLTFNAANSVSNHFNQNVLSIVMIGITTPLSSLAEESLALIGTASCNKPGEGSTKIRGGFDKETRRKAQAF